MTMNLKKLCALLCIFPIQNCIASPDDISIELINGLKHAINQTHYAALIQQQKIQSIDLTDDDKIDGYTEVKHIIHAKVLETYHGEEKRHIHYSMIMDKHEEIKVINTPVIITLCKIGNEMVWAGVGSEFQVSETLISKAKEFSQAVDRDKTEYEYCE